MYKDMRLIVGIEHKEVAGSSAPSSPPCDATLHALSPPSCMLSATPRLHALSHTPLAWMHGRYGANWTCSYDVQVEINPTNGTHDRHARLSRLFKLTISRLLKLTIPRLLKLTSPTHGLLPHTYRH